VAWSLGGPRAGGYAAQHPEKVQKLVLLAPGYGRAASDNPPPQPPAGAAMNTQSRAEFVANWDRQVGCPDQCDAGVSDGVWSQMLESDPVRATWGSGVRRAPQTTNWGWNAAMVAKTQTPTLMVAGVRQAGVACPRPKALRGPGRAREGLRRSQLLLAQRDVGEEPHPAVQASLEWLTQGTVNGAKDGCSASATTWTSFRHFTRQILPPPSSETSSDPSLPTVTPIGRPQVVIGASRSFTAVQSVSVPGCKVRPTSS
jgi:pimeloyl-ACP methyl ester carboxylesterase